MTRYTVRDTVVGSVEIQKDENPVSQSTSGRDGRATVTVAVGLLDRARWDQPGPEGDR